MVSKQDTKQDIGGLINAVTAAALKGFNRTEAFMYHVNHKPGTPQPIEIDGIRFWQRAEIEKWTPTRNTPGPKPTKEGKINVQSK